MACLKIKDSVDLKELEKFGFSVVDAFNWGTGKNETYYLQNYNGEGVIKVWDTIHHGLIELYANGYCNRKTPVLIVLFDLIQAGLVEKVVEE